jgi:hypothetical protein
MYCDIVWSRSFGTIHSFILNDIKKEIAATMHATCLDFELFCLDAQ